MRYPQFLNSPFIRAAVLIPYSIFLVMQEQIDIVICAVPVSIGLTGFILKKIFKIPYCVFYYGGEFAKYQNKKTIKWLLKNVLEHADCIITNSEFTSQEVNKYGIDENKVFKIAPGVDTEKFKPGIDCFDLKRKLNLNEKKVLLTVSRLVKRKGIDAVINTLPRLMEEFPSAVYLVVGRGEEEAYLKRLAVECGVEENVIFLGFVSDDELPKYYNVCDIYVMPNKETSGEETLEGFGISFIEASACAKAVVGGVSGGVKEAVVDGETGVLVDPEDIPLLSETICRLLRDAAYNRRLGENGRRRTEREFQWQDRAAYLREILEKICPRK